MGKQPAENSIENLKVKQEEEAESMISTQFKLEQVVYCQDGIYSEDLKTVRTKSVSVSASTAAKQCSMEEVMYHSSRNRLGSQIPLIIQGYIFQDYAEKLQSAMLHLLQQMKDQFSNFLSEQNEAGNRRKALKEWISRLTKAQEHLAKFSV
ncbi:interferon-induced GTP-binding protein Mx1-like [Heteronotia binoei]|uniref:interferon-induced GTP-binding protein Mx1-like n=1 Tax=Heteronotia binoei TaxID=13085 RepID=UPI00292FE321|nr:interferon-induced GTP-binding protein Mx1-like [Heteronotia binoei]